MFPEEKGYVAREFERLDDFYCHLMECDTDKTFYLLKETLDYAKKNASYFAANFDETSGIVRLYINGCGMTIIYSKAPTEFCKKLYPINAIYLDDSKNEYLFVSVSTTICNF